MGGYTTVWERRSAFDDDGRRRRTAGSLAEARLIMQMAFVAEPGFRPVRIVDAAGRLQSYELIDPSVSEQDYVSRGFEHYDEWVAQPLG